MNDMTPEAAAALRKPFDAKSVGKLPKAGMSLDYVGHAAVTDRLLAVDPLWSWEPFATTEDGLPALDRSGNLWIRLTICGVTRIGVGDGKNAKEVIGDGIRNAAMRFGVALDLWSKEELESVDADDVFKASKPMRRAAPTPKLVNEASEERTDKQNVTIQTLAGKLGLDRDSKLAGISAVLGRTVTTTNQLTKVDAATVIDSLSATLKARETVQETLGGEVMEG